MSGGLFLQWRIDPRWVWQVRRGRGSAEEAFGMGEVGGGKHFGSLGLDGRGPAAQRLRSLLSARIAALVRLNPSRVDLVERFERLVQEYNDGSKNVEAFFQELLQFGQDLTEEEARSLSENLTEEQLAIFDLLMRPAPELSDDERTQVKRVAEELLAVLKRGKIVLDWRKEQATRAAVRVAVEETLDRLPDKFTRQIYAQKCDVVYQHVFDSYWDGHSVYDRAA